MGTGGTEEEPSAGATDKFSLEVAVSVSVVCAFSALTTSETALAILFLPINTSPVYGKIPKI